MRASKYHISTLWVEASDQYCAHYKREMSELADKHNKEIVSQKEIVSNIQANVEAYKRENNKLKEELEKTKDLNAQSNIGLTNLSREIGRISSRCSLQ